MLLDDHAMFREGLRALLEPEPDIEVVADLSSGIDIVGRISFFVPDILILDMEMPDISGPRVARQVIASARPVDILAVSAHDDASYVQSMLELGAAGYLCKDESVALLVQAIRGISRGERGWFSRRGLAAVSNAGKHGLTAREIEVLTLIGRDRALAEIAAALGVTPSTIKTHAQRIYRKIGLKDLREARRWARRHGFA